MEGALRRPWWVGGPFRPWESFFVLWEMNSLFLFLNPFRAPEPLPILNPSNFVPKNGFQL